MICFATPSRKFDPNGMFDALEKSVGLTDNLDPTRRAIWDMFPLQKFVGGTTLFFARAQGIHIILDQSLAMIRCVANCSGEAGTPIQVGVVPTSDCSVGRILPPYLHRAFNAQRFLA